MRDIIRYIVPTSAALVLLGASPARALYDYAVTGVAQGDVLNIREGVEQASQISRARIIGAIPPDATGIRGTGMTVRVGDSLWRQVTFQGVTGWVADRFLREIPSGGGDAAPTALSCSGTEPFWSMTFRAGSAVRENPFGKGGPATSAYIAGQPKSAEGRSHVWSVALQRSDRSGDATAVFWRTDACSDGMSDLIYPIEFVLSEAGSGGVVLSGCCRLGR